jgi:1-acyl-sn-glycerol-3-phosphate acyltransferase
MIGTALDRAWRVLFTGSSFLFFFSGALFLSWVILPLVALTTRDPVVRGRRCRRVVRRTWIGFHDWMRWTRLLDYDPRAVRLRLPDGPYMLVANHPTLVDVTALIAAVPDAVVVVKRSWVQSFLVGRVIRHCRHIDAGDGGAFSAVGVYEQALAHLAEGTPVLFFPEGTRSPERALGEFRLGAFQIAARARVPVIPVLLRCEPPTLMRGQSWYEIPERTAVLTVEALPQLDADGRTPGQLARASRETYLRAFARAPEPGSTDSVEPIVASSGG